MASLYMPDVVVEIAFNAGYSTADASRAWTDVSAYVELAEGIDIGFGRSDERSTADANTLTLTLDNRDGRFTAGRAASPYYPNVKVGRPIRVTATPVGGAASVRFAGYINDWPVEWTGTDAYAKAIITATSRLARLGLSAGLRSLLEEEILSDEPDGYYPLSEPEGAVSGADISGNSRATLVQYGAGAAVSFGTSTGPTLDGLPAPTFSGRGLIAPAASSVYTNPYTLEAFFATSSLAATTPVAAIDGLVLAVTVSSGVSVELTIGGVLYSAFGGTSVNDGLVHHVAATVTPGVEVALFLDGVEVASAAIGSGARVGTGLQVANRYYTSGASSITFPGSVSHVAYWASALSDAAILRHATAGLTAFPAETPGARLARYARLAGAPTVETSFATGTSAIAAIDTTGANPVDLMRTVETTDGGVLFDARNGTLTYLDRSGRYLPTPAISLSMTAQQVGASFAPKLDRSALLNDVTAATSDGTIVARAVNTASRDEYGPHTDSIDLATTSETAPHEAAWWRVNTYGEPKPRVPNIDVEFLSLATFEQTALMGVTIGSLIEVTAQPSQAPTSSASYFVEGYTESISPESYSFSFNVSPSEAYLTTFVLEDAMRGKLDDVYRIAY